MIDDPTIARPEYLRLRSALFDRITGLPALPLLFDELRELLERILGEPRTPREEIEERRRRARESDPAPAAFVPGSAPTW